MEGHRGDDQGFWREDQGGLQQPVQGRVSAAISSAADSQSSSRSMAQMLLMAYASAMNHLILSIGLLFLTQAYTAAQEVNSSLGVASDDGLFEAMLLMVGTFIKPYSQALFELIVPGEISEAKALHMWLPGLLGLAVCFSATLGQLALRRRRAVYVLPYLIIAVSQLVWHVEFTSFLKQVVDAEDVPAIVRFQNGHRKFPRLHDVVFEGPYKNFAGVYQEQRCSAKKPAGPTEPVKMQCQRDGLEGRVMQFTVAEFCLLRGTRTPQEILDFKGRVEACESHGRVARVLSQAPNVRDHVFCRCRTAMYDWIRITSSWLVVGWCFQLFGVILILYFAVEKNLAAMEPTQRKEILGFVTVGTGLLILRATVLYDYFDEDGVEDA